MVGLGEYEALVLGDLDKVDVVGGGDGEEAALPGYEEEVGHLSLLLQLQGQLHAGPPVHQHSPALPKNVLNIHQPDPGKHKYHPVQLLLLDINTILVRKKSSTVEKLCCGSALGAMRIWF